MPAMEGMGRGGADAGRNGRSCGHRETDRRLRPARVRGEYHQLHDPRGVAPRGHLGFWIYSSQSHSRGQMIRAAEEICVGRAMGEVFRGR